LTVCADTFLVLNKVEVLKMLATKIKTRGDFMVTDAQLRRMNDCFDQHHLPLISTGIKGWEQLLIENIETLAARARA
jgi:hypothetical protein